MDFKDKRILPLLPNGIVINTPDGKYIPNEDYRLIDKNKAFQTNNWIAYDYSKKEYVFFTPLNKDKEVVVVNAQPQLEGYQITNYYSSNGNEVITYGVKSQGGNFDFVQIKVGRDYPQPQVKHIFSLQIPKEDVEKVKKNIINKLTKTFKVDGKFLFKQLIEKVGINVNTNRKSLYFPIFPFGDTYIIKVNYSVATYFKDKRRLKKLLKNDEDKYNRLVNEIVAEGKSSVGSKLILFNDKGYNVLDWTPNLGEKINKKYPVKIPLSQSIEGLHINNTGISFIVGEEYRFVDNNYNDAGKGSYFAVFEGTPNLSDIKERYRIFIEGERYTLDVKGNVLSFTSINLPYGIFGIYDQVGGFLVQYTYKVREQTSSTYNNILRKQLEKILFTTKDGWEYVYKGYINLGDLPFPILSKPELVEDIVYPQPNKTTYYKVESSYLNSGIYVMDSNNPEEGDMHQISARNFKDIQNLLIDYIKSVGNIDGKVEPKNLVGVGNYLIVQQRNKLYVFEVNFPKKEEGENLHNYFQRIEKILEVGGKDTPNSPIKLKGVKEIPYKLKKTDTKQLALVYSTDGMPNLLWIFKSGDNYLLKIFQIDTKNGELNEITPFIKVEELIVESMTPLIISTQKSDDGSRLGVSINFTSSSKRKTISVSFPIDFDYNKEISYGEAPFMFIDDFTKAIANGKPYMSNEGMLYIPHTNKDGITSYEYIPLNSSSPVKLNDKYTIIEFDYESEDELKINGLIITKGNGYNIVGKNIC